MVYIDKDVLSTLAYELDDDMYDSGEEEETEVEEEKCAETLHRVQLDWVNHARKCLHETSFSIKYHHICLFLQVSEYSEAISRNK
jgi:hypothetical protein